RQLRRNLLNFQRAWRLSRDSAFEHLEQQGGLGVAEASFGGQRARLASAKRVALDERGAQFARFKTAAEAAGAVVYESTSAQDAVRYIVDLCQRRGARLVTKGKSMVSEELFLNHALEAARVEVVETELGEGIIQLARETPSHMVMPAIHKSRQQVSGLIGARTARPVSREDVGDMAGAARQELRRIFDEGDVGITGANALSAENGTVMLVNNVSYGRMNSSLQPVHVLLAY